MITREVIEDLYVTQGLSMQQIAVALECSPNKVVYWMDQHSIKRRSISDAIYRLHNPDGDPFVVKPITTKAEAELFGMGMGLYWGEGTKASKHSVCLGNTDPALLRKFMEFLIELFAVKKESFKFGLQIFTDIDPEKALNFWVDALEVSPSQFYKIHVTISGSLGTYKRKSAYGVVTVYFHNKKLRDILVSMLPT